MSTAGITTSWLVDRNKFLDSLRDITSIATDSAAQINALNPTMNIRARDLVTEAVSQIIAQNSGKAIEVDVVSKGGVPTGDSDGGGGLGGGLGGFRGLIRAKDMADRIYKMATEFDDATDLLDAAKIDLKNQSAGGAIGALMDRSGLTTALGGETEKEAKATVVSMTSTQLVDKMMAEYKEQRVAIHGEENVANRTFTPYDTKLAPDLRYLNQIGQQETQGGFTPQKAISQISQEADQIQEAINKRDVKRKELRSRAAELQARDTSSDDPAAQAERRAIENESQANEADSSAGIDRIKKRGEEQRQQIKEENDSLKDQQSIRDVITQDQISGKETLAKKGEVELKETEDYHKRVLEFGQAAADDWKRNIGDPQSAFQKTQIQQEKDLHDFKVGAQATSIVSKSLEQQEEASGETGLAKRQERLRIAQEEAEEARKTAESKKGTEDYAGLSRIASAKEAAAGALPGIMDIEDQIKAERELAQAHATRLGIYDQESAKIAEIKQKYADLILAEATPEGKAARGEQEQAELDAVHERQQRNINDIKEHTKEQSLRAKNMDEEANKAAINYKIDEEVDKQRKAYAIDKDETHQDTIKALEEERKAELAAAEPRNVSFSSPLAAWEKMQKIAFDTPAVAQAILPKEGGTHGKGYAVGNQNADLPSLGDAPQKLADAGDAIMKAVSGAVTFGIISDGYGF